MIATTPQDSSHTACQPTGDGHCTLADRGFHLIGIGGAGMSVVAQLLAARGARVSGSDAHGGPAFDHLSDLGITTHLGHDAAHVPERSTVVVSTAIKETNPELAEARRRGQEVIHRSQALALAAQGLDFVAVAGAHGKTTTSGMLAEALTDAGADPSFAIGGVVRALGTGAHLGSGSALVAEADESDRSFLNYSPRVEIVTNVEPDHLDSYGTAEAFEAAFVDFAHRLVPGGLLVACAADAGALRLAQSAAAEGLRVVTYSFGGPDTLPGGVLVGEGHVHLDIQDRGASSTQALLTLTTATDRESAGGTGDERQDDQQAGAQASSPVRAVPEAEPRVRIRGRDHHGAAFARLPMSAEEVLPNDSHTGAVVVQRLRPGSAPHPLGAGDAHLAGRAVVGHLARVPGRCLRRALATISIALAE